MNELENAISNNNTEGTSSKYLLYDFFIKVIIPFIVVIALVNIFLNFEPDNKEDQVTNAWMAGNKKPALSHLKTQVQENFFNLKTHRRYLDCHYDIYPNEVASTAHNKKIINEYNSYTQSTDPNTVDIGWYGLGYFHAIRNQRQEALEYYDSVKNRNLIFLNNSIGYCYQKLDQPKKAEAFFLREIEISGNIEGAYHNLSKLYIEAKEFETLRELIENNEVRQYISPRIIRYMELRGGNIFPYLKDALGIRYTTGAGFIAALFILIIWFQYLRKLDAFEPEPMKFLLAVLIAGMIFSMACDFLYDFYRFNLNMTIKHYFFNDLIYCIFGIGFIEETVKIIPFFIILKFTKQINESIDYIIYAAISALGFAFMENLLYFQDFGLRSISGRCLTAAMMHMALTSLIAYGLFYAKYKKKNPMIFFVITFCAACIIHGLYDFWIISDVVSDFKIVSLLILVYCITMFSNMIKNTLNHSEFNIEQKTTIEGLARYLVYSLSYVFLLQYVLLAWKFGATNAKYSLLKNIFSVYIWLLIIFVNLGKINIERGKWIPLLNNKSKK